MRKWIWIALIAAPMAVAGGSYAKSKQSQAPEGYTCTITGENLKCPNCCPLNQNK